MKTETPPKTYYALTILAENTRHCVLQKRGEGLYLDCTTSLEGMTSDFIKFLDKSCESASGPDHAKETKDFFINQLKPRVISFNAKDPADFIMKSLATSSQPVKITVNLHKSTEKAIKAGFIGIPLKPHAASFEVFDFEEHIKRLETPHLLLPPITMDELLLVAKQHQEAKEA